MRTHWNRMLPAAVLLCVALSPSPARPAADEPALPPAVDRDLIGLREAVDLTLRIDPQVRLARQAIASAEGQLRQAQGVFDQIISVRPSYTYDEHANFPSVIKQQKKTRDLIQGIAEGYAEFNQSLLDALEQNTLVFPACPDGIELDEVNILEGRDQVDTSGLTFEDAFIIRLGGLDQDAAGVFDLCFPKGDPSLRPENIRVVLDRINDIMGLGLILELTQLQRERLSLLQNIAEAVAVKADLALTRLGQIPEDEATKTIALELGWLKPTRSGTSVRSDLRLQSTERNFKGKSLDPTHGGMGLRNQFPSSLSLSVDVPLMRGGGRKTVEAPERAAERGIAAQRELLRHTMSNEVFGTVLAYLDLRAAQDRMALLDESVARQRRIVDITRELIDSGDVARSELARVQARSALVESAAADGRLALLASRFVLADAIGLKVGSLTNAPLAADSLPQRFVQLEPVDKIADRALTERRDHRALDELREASRILADAGRANLRHRLDFFMTGGMSTLYESPFFRFLEDELDPDQVPEDDFVGYDSGRGFYRSLEGTWKPFVVAGFRFEVPFKNNAARGRLRQQESSLRSSEVELTELGRAIREKVIEINGAIEFAREAIDRRRETIGFYEQTLTGALDMFESGDISLIDLLTTEEELTAEKLRLVRVVQLHQSLLARLQFEAGGLLRFKAEGTADESASFDPFLFVSPTSG